MPIALLCAMGVTVLVDVVVGLRVAAGVDVSVGLTTKALHEVNAAIKAERIITLLMVFMFSLALVGYFGDGYPAHKAACLIPELTR